jgi:hypothetical protein
MAKKESKRQKAARKAAAAIKARNKRNREALKAAQGAVSPTRVKPTPEKEKAKARKIYSLDELLGKKKPKKKTVKKKSAKKRVR